LHLHVDSVIDNINPLTCSNVIISERSRYASRRFNDGLRAQAIEIDRCRSSIGRVCHEAVMRSNDEGRGRWVQCGDIGISAAGVGGIVSDENRACGTKIHTEGCADSSSGINCRAGAKTKGRPCGCGIRRLHEGVDVC